MAQLRRVDPTLALTLAEHRALNLRRPLTDDPLGQNAARRNLNAAISATFNDPDTAINQHIRRKETR